MQFKKISIIVFSIVSNSYGIEFNNAKKTVNYITFKAMDKAICENNLALIKKLSNEFAFNTYSCASILHLATEKSNYHATIKILLNSGIDIDKLDCAGNTILHLAVNRNDLALVKYIVNCGAHINSVNTRGETPLHRAARINNDNPDITKYLIENGAQPDVKDFLNNTPSDLAEILGNETIFTSLCTYINAKKENTHYSLAHLKK